MNSDLRLFCTTMKMAKLIFSFSFLFFIYAET